MNNEIDYLYTANGSKVNKKVTNGTTIAETDYLYGFEQDSYKKSTTAHREGTAAAFANYLYNMVNEENQSNSIDTVQPLINRFNNLKTGVTITADNSGGNSTGWLQLYVNGKSVSYSKIDEKAHSE